MKKRIVIKSLTALVLKTLQAVLKVTALGLARDQIHKKIPFKFILQLANRKKKRPNHRKMQVLKISTKAKCKKTLKVKYLMEMSLTSQR